MRDAVRYLCRSVFLGVACQLYHVTDARTVEGPRFQLNSQYWRAYRFETRLILYEETSFLISPPSVRLSIQTRECPRAINIAEF
jgi:hypothetical protein